MSGEQPTTTLIQDFIWYSNSPILFVCAFNLYWKRQLSNFPVFFGYLIFTGVSSYAMLPVTKTWGFNSNPTFYTWLGSNIISISLSFIVLYEVVRNVMTSGTIKVERSTFVIVVSLLLIAGALISMTLRAENDQIVMKVIFIVSNVLRFDQTGLLIALATMTLFFGFYWGDLAFGIAAGFGIYAAMEILRIYLRAHIGPGSSHFTNLISQWSYQIASLVWLFYTLKKLKLPPPVLPSDKVSEYTRPIERMIR